MVCGEGRRFELAGLVQNDASKPTECDVIVLVERLPFHLPPPPRPLKARLRAEGELSWLVFGVFLKDLGEIGPFSPEEAQILRTEGTLLLGQMAFGAIFDVRQMEAVAR